MKNVYVSPELELISFFQDPVLAPSGENIVLESGKNSSGSVADEFGDVTLW